MTDPKNDPEIDVDAIKRRYAEEREKRLRKDATAQYQELSGNLASFADDPWSTAEPREALREDVDVCIVGGGLGGILCGVRLRQQGVKSLRIIDSAGGFGGAWYWNRYPGCACDVDSYCYLPLLEETGYIPSEKYASANEIRAHLERVAEQFDLYPAGLFNTSVDAVTWDEEARRYRVHTDRGDEIAARFVISSTGLLNKPKLPGIPGITEFAGHAFHTSRWDYGYTGGDWTGNMTGLADKVVGIIGTGSTGIQAIPRLAKDAKHLYVFQRTPSSVDYRGHRKTDPDWVATLEPGWAQARRENFTHVTSGYRWDEDLVDDAWTELMKITNPPKDANNPPDPKEIELAEMKKMEATRRRIGEIVEDPATAEALKPWYSYGCKRPTFSDEYLQTFNRPNVTLVDTMGQGVERMTPTGAVVAGKEITLDCMVFATGFDFMTEYGKETGITVTGRGGKTLGEHWSRGMRTQFGMQTSEFPNFFLINMIQSGISQNYTHVADEQAIHIGWTIGECLRRDIRTIELTHDAEEAWIDEVLAHVERRRAFLEACTPGYYNYEGKKDRSRELNETYGGGPVPYFNRLREWRESGTFPGMSVEESADA